MAKKEKTVPSRTRVRASRAVRKDIAEAVESLPNLIMQEAERSGRQDGLPDVPEPVSPRASAAYPQAGSRWLMWFGVATMSAAVFLLWGWNMKALVSDFGGSKSAEVDLLQRATGDLNSIFSAVAAESADRFENTGAALDEQAIAPETQEQTDKDAVRRTLESVFAGMASSTAATSSR
ncbi:MAG: hypothetical protein A3C90_01570 [Candidatus Magasanikbacteria bacterium RIFCSPHIGHO2_02_FULL_51_14]|uniref:Uncharacterized protein n=1 Tax=Candidatus Magasanikbacteria bacterium RIFCSPHIGHO2_02_FULL_51_14 TaxID=1798683 RepID=A0A1F6ME14_9BACT|nr:MAG: hypothetical protein A3C90_01570 [Candidatus Magasanikbacteria bacterium RIFCSPHIGHO2_02_FULL_51_14]